MNPEKLIAATLRNRPSLDPEKVRERVVQISDDCANGRVLDHQPTKYIDIVFDGPPSAQSGRFVEVEDDRGYSMNFGEWVHRPDGYWALRFPAKGIIS